MKTGWTRLALLLVVLLSSMPARAEDRKARARAHYQEGMALFQSGDYVAAVRELTAAHVLHAHPTIAIELGRAHQKRDDLVGAVDAYTAALDSPELARRDRAELVEKVRALNGQIGALTVECEVKGARVRVNGQDVGKTPLPGPVRVSPGKIDVEVSASGHAVAVQTLSVKPGFQTSAAFELRDASGQPAEITIDTPLAEADILVDGKRHGAISHSRMVMVTPGNRSIALQREGYRTAQVRLPVAPAAKLAVVLSPTRDLTVSAPTGTLELRVEPSDASVKVDGVAVATREVTLPAGAHHVTLAKEGFMTVTRRVALTAGGSEVVEVSLPPSSDMRAGMLEDAESQRSLVFALGAVGIGLTIAGIAVTAWSIGKLVDANDAEADVRRSTACQFEEASCGVAIREAEGEQGTAAGFITGGAIGTALGIGAFSLCVWLYVSGRDPDELRIDTPPELGMRLWPDVVLSPDGGYLGVRGSF